MPLKWQSHAADLARAGLFALGVEVFALYPTASLSAVSVASRWRAACLVLPGWLLSDGLVVGRVTANARGDAYVAEAV